MTWLVWRQHRNQAYVAAAALAAFAVLLLVTGRQMASQYHSALTSCTASHTCGNLANTLILGTPVLSLLVTLTVVVPCLLGVFWGGPLVARELETGTSQFAWTQSITRSRWLTVKVGWALLAAAAWGGAVSALVTWWSSPVNALQHQNFQPSQFDIQGIVPVGYALFAVALGIAAGALLRRTLPALAITIVVFTFLRLVIGQDLRPHYLTALTMTYNFLHPPALPTRVLLAGLAGHRWPGRPGAEQPGHGGPRISIDGVPVPISQHAVRVPGARLPDSAQVLFLPDCSRIPRVHHLPARQPVLGIPGHRDRHLRAPRRRPHRRDSDRSHPPRRLASSTSPRNPAGPSLASAQEVALPAAECGVQRRRAELPHVVGDVDRDPGGNDLVDAVEHVAGQVDPVGGEVAVQVLHGARTDDRGGDRRVAGGERDRHLDERQPGLVGERAERVGGVELGGVRRVGRVIAPGKRCDASGGARPADLLALAVFARQPPAGQRAVGHDAHSVALAGRQHVVLDRPGQHGVRGLLGAKPSVAAAIGDPLRLDDLRGGNLRRAEGSDLAGAHEVGQGAEGLVDIGVRIGNAHLVEVDPVGLQPAQRALDRLR